MEIKCRPAPPGARRHGASIHLGSPAVDQKGRQRCRCCSYSLLAIPRTVRSRSLADRVSRLLSLYMVVVPGRAGLELPPAVVTAEVHLLRALSCAGSRCFGLDHHAAD